MSGPNGEHFFIGVNRNASSTTASRDMRRLCSRPLPDKPSGEPAAGAVAVQRGSLHRRRSSAELGPPVLNFEGVVQSLSSAAPNNHLETGGEDGAEF